jgi:Ca-activated chloride channel family protein
MSILTPFRFNALMHPWFLALLLLVPLVFLAEYLAPAPGAITVSTGETMARVSVRRGARFRWLPPLLRAGGLSFLTFALAGPLQGFQPQKSRTNIIDIMLCVDVSGSMRAMDFEYGGRRRDRLYVTKTAVQDFLKSRKGRTQDRFGLDRVGLILYAGYAWTQCPLTLDYGVLEHELELAQIDEEDPRKNGTAIGSAIGLAVSRLRKSEAKSKVIILLTDGMNNRGELDPLTAADLAKEFGIRIYTIGAGSGSEAYVLQRDPLFGGERPLRVNAPIDEESLKKIAETTDGKFYRAPDTTSLEAAYAEISQLEATEIELDDYYEHKEAFLPYAVVGTLAMALAVLGRRAWFETIP